MEVCASVLKSVLLFVLAAVFGASESDLTSIQNFLDRCYKSRFISYPILINDLLNKQDCKIFKKTLSV